MNVNNIRGKEWDNINSAVNDVVLGKQIQEGSKEEYKKFFQSALKKFGVKSPSELKDDQKKKFYDYVDKNWKSDDEKNEEVEEEHGAGEEGTDELCNKYKKDTPGQSPVFSAEELSHFEKIMELSNDEE